MVTWPAPVIDSGVPFGFSAIPMVPAVLTLKFTVAFAATVIGAEKLLSV